MDTGRLISTKMGTADIPWDLPDPTLPMRSLWDHPVTGKQQFRELPGTWTIPPSEVTGDTMKVLPMTYDAFLFLWKFRRTHDTHSLGDLKTLERIKTLSGPNPYPPYLTCVSIPPISIAADKSEHANYELRRSKRVVIPRDFYKP